MTHYLVTVVETVVYRLPVEASDPHVAALNAEEDVTEAEDRDQWAVAVEGRSSRAASPVCSWIAEGSPCPISAPVNRHGHPGDTNTCVHCGRPIAVSDDAHWFHPETGVCGWVDDPADAAHRATPTPF